MALTNDELETALNSALKRIAALEKVLNNTVSTQQMNAVTLLLEKDIDVLKTDNTTSKARLTVLEATVNDLV